MLSEAVKRDRVHTREINLNGYRRDDGLIDIEGEITDVKTYSFPNRERGMINAGDPIHHMQVRITINMELEIVAAPFRRFRAISAQALITSPFPQSTENGSL